MDANLSRRDMVKLAAALGAARAPLPALPPAEAAAALAAPAAAPLPSAETGPALLDPARFAAETDAWVGARVLDESAVAAIAPAEHAAYARARAALIRRLPVLEDLPWDHPFHARDEAAHAWAVVAYMGGLRAGAAYEHLRRALLGAVQTCPRCQGMGSLERGGGRPPMAGGSEICPTCSGAGTVPICTA